MSELHRIGESRTEGSAVDVIFVHGLGGDPFETWAPTVKPLAFRRKKKDSWPHWLAGESIAPNVYSLEYEATPSRWLGTSMPLLDRSRNALARLTTEGIGDRPIVFVTHSLGGLLVKQMLRHAKEFGNKRWQKVWEQTRGVVFVATPHAGARIADWLGHLRTVLRTSVATEELSANAPTLRDLNTWFRHQASISKIGALSFYETVETKGVLVVDETSADPGIAGSVSVPLDADHLSICKPDKRTDLIYKRVLQFVEECLLDQSADEVPEPPTQSKTPPAPSKRKPGLFPTGHLSAGDATADADRPKATKIPERARGPIETPARASRPPETQRAPEPRREAEPPAETPTPLWQKIVGLVAVAAAVAWGSYTFGQSEKVRKVVTVESHAFLSRMGEQDDQAIAEMTRTPFYLGLERLDSQDAVRRQFAAMFRHARERTESESDSQSIRGGAELSRYLADQLADKSFNVFETVDLQIQPDLDSEDEEKRPATPIPDPSLLEDGARVAVNLRGLNARNVRTVYLYFNVLEENPALRAVVLQRPPTGN